MLAVGTHRIEWAQNVLYHPLPGGDARTQQGTELWDQLLFTLTCVAPKPGPAVAAVLGHVLGPPAENVGCAQSERFVVAPFPGEVPGIDQIAVDCGEAVEIDICTDGGTPTCVQPSALEKLRDDCANQVPIDGVDRCVEDARHSGGAGRLATVAQVAAASKPVESVGIVFFHLNAPFDSVPEGVQTGVALIQDADGKSKNNNPPRRGQKYDMLTCLDHLYGPAYDEPPRIEGTDFTTNPWKTIESDITFLYGTDWFAAIIPNPRGRYGATVLSVRNGGQVAADLGITGWGQTNDGKDKKCKMPVKPADLLNLSAAPAQLLDLSAVIAGRAR